MENNQEGKSQILLENRKILNITGVVEVMNFNDEVINLNTNLGLLQILGTTLKINKIDVKNGDVAISGKVKSMIYKSQEKKKRRKINFIKRAFKKQ
ncbi:MAG: sporulation protein YabP [Sarcina sp.]